MTTKTSAKRKPPTMKPGSKPRMGVVACLHNQHPGLPWNANRYTMAEHIANIDSAVQLFAERGYPMTDAELEFIWHRARTYPY